MLSLLLVLSSVESASRFCTMMVLGEVREAILVWNAYHAGLPASQEEAQNLLIGSTCSLVSRLIGLVCMCVCLSVCVLCSNSAYGARKGSLEGFQTKNSSS